MRVHPSQREALQRAHALRRMSSNVSGRTRPRLAARVPLVERHCAVADCIKELMQIQESGVILQRSTEVFTGETKAR